MPEAEDPSDLPCDVDDPSFCFEAGTLFLMIEMSTNQFHPTGFF